jgi:azurin
MKKILLFIGFVYSLFLVACNNEKEKTKDNDTTQSANAPAKISNTIEITANDSMKFSTIELNVKAGEKVTLTFKNVGTAPKASMAHNWILLKDNTNLDAFAKEAGTAPDYIPVNNPNILAHTKLLGPGESDTIEFTVPPGPYMFVCSFPTHMKTMLGILTAS